MNETEESRNKTTPMQKLSFYKDAKAILWRRDSLFNNGARKIKYLYTKKKKL